MSSRRRDRGAVTMSVLAPILAAVIGGGAAILGAIQIVNLAPSTSDSSVSSSGAVDYGNTQP